jgi:hypothetical protein
MTIRISFSDTTVRVAVEINGAIESKVVELPQRTWVGLTEEEIKPFWYEACQTDLELTSQLVVYFARAIEAKLRSKNNV